MSSFELGGDVERFCVSISLDAKGRMDWGWGPEWRQGDPGEQGRDEASLGQLRLWEEETLVHSQRCGGGIERTW